MDVKILMLAIVAFGITTSVLSILLLQQKKTNRQNSEYIKKTIAEQKRSQETLSEQLHTMSKISRGFLAANNERAIIELVLEHAMIVTGAAGASFVPLNERGLPASVIRQGDFPFPHPDAWLEYLASPAIRQQCNECKNQGTFINASCPLLIGPFSQAAGLFCMPLRRADQDLGVLNLYLPDEQKMRPETRDFLSSLIDETSLALESVRLRKRERLVINELKSVRQRNNIDHILGDLLRSIRTILEVDYVVLAIRGFGIDWSSDEVLIDQLIFAGKELSNDDQKEVGRALHQAYSSRRDWSDKILVGQIHGNIADTMIVESVRIEDQSPVGVIAVGSRDLKSFDESKKLLLHVLAGQLAFLIENTQNLTDMKYKAMMEERSRLAREIHDGLAQTLGFLKLQTAQMQSSLEKKDLDKLQFFLKASYAALSEAYQDAREAIDGLRLVGIRTDDEPPLSLDDAIERVIKEYHDNNMLSNIKVHLQNREDVIELAPEITAQLLRILQEALSNVRKHSAASQVWVKTRANTKDIIMEIKDNGRGFAAEDIPEVSKHGLIGMRERAELIGADFQVISRPGEGTAVVVRLPHNSAGKRLEV